MIEVKAVTHTFNGRAALDDVSVVIDSHRTAIIGSNGSGKTTFARLLNGLLMPDRGEVVVFGVSTKADGRAARRKVGLVFQNPDTQIVMPTVEEDMAFGLENQRVPKAEIAKRVTRWLTRFGLIDKREHPAALLSGGEKKLLSILSVLIMEPALVVFDEPFASLDLVNRRRIATLIDGLTQPAVIVTHELGEVQRFDRALCFAGGRLLAEGKPADVVCCYLETVTDCSPSMSLETPPSIERQPV